MKITFSSNAWAEYVEWQNQDKKILKRINLLIKDIERSPFKGVGKPEPLKGEYSGFWSRRIDHCHRLVYQIQGKECQIIQYRGHYNS